MSYFFEDITIKNFKVFKSAKTFKLGRINVLTGKNNSGKSSLIEFIDLLNKSINLRNLASFPLSELKGAKSFEDCLNIQSKSKNLEVKIPVKLDYFDSEGEWLTPLIPGDELGHGFLDILGTAPITGGINANLYDSNMNIIPGFSNREIPLSFSGLNLDEYSSGFYIGINLIYIS